MNFEQLIKITKSLKHIGIDLIFEINGQRVDLNEITVELALKIVAHFNHPKPVRI